MGKKKHKKGKSHPQSRPRYDKGLHNKATQNTQPEIGIINGGATLSFQASDTLFFRESRPMEAMNELQSVFPPPVRTMAGALRTLIGDTLQVQWHTFNQDHELAKIIGYGDDLGQLAFQGAWLVWHGQRLYPAPLLFMRQDHSLFRLTLAKEPVHCDLGKQVRFPSLPVDAQGSKSLENTWLTKAGLETVLLGGKPALTELKTADALFERESRLGIARENTTRTVKQGLLYQTEHIRPKQGLTIELDARGLPDTFPTQAIIRLGGEGRTASLSLAASSAVPRAPDPGKRKLQGLLLYLLTPLQQTHHSREDWQPLPNFGREEGEHQTVWTGTLNGIELELHSAITGKPIRQGGWDMAIHQPRPVISQIPAGSVFFCSAKNGDAQSAISALHNTQIGDLTDYGYGHLAAGLWLEDKGKQQ